MADGRRIAFDTAILATGTKYPKFPIAKPLGQSTIALRDRHSEQEHDKFLASESFLVIGGGVVGVELGTMDARPEPGEAVYLTVSTEPATEFLAADKRGAYVSRAILRGFGSKARAPRPYKIGTTPILVPIGANRGFAQLPFGLVTWKGLVDIKRKDYMIGMFRKKLGIRG